MFDAQSSSNKDQNQVFIALKDTQFTMKHTKAYIIYKLFTSVILINDIKYF